MNRNLKQLKNDIDNLERQIPSEDVRKTRSERLDFFSDIFMSKDCRDYIEFMGAGQEDDAKKILNKYSDDVKKVIKDVWVMEVKYGDLFERIAFTKREIKSQQNNIREEK
jgi:hypothetical protein